MTDDFEKDEDDGGNDDVPVEIWYVVEKSVYILEKGLLLLGSKETPLDFTVEIKDMVEIVRPNGSKTRSRVLDIYSSNERAGGDLLVDGMRPTDVPPGSRLRVMQGKRRRH